MTLQLTATQRRVTLDTYLTAERFSLVFSRWKFNTTLFLFLKNIYIFIHKRVLNISYFYFYRINIILIRWLFSLQSILSTCIPSYTVVATRRNCLKKSDIILLYYNKFTPLSKISTKTDLIIIVSRRRLFSSKTISFSIYYASR